MTKPETVKDARERCREKFQHWPLVLVIHVNNFTRQIESGYLLRHGVKSGSMMPAKMVIAMLALDPATPVEFLSV